jgi:hypothetical protein
MPFQQGKKLFCVSKKKARGKVAKKFGKFFFLKPKTKHEKRIVNEMSADALKIYFPIEKLSSFIADLGNFSLFVNSKLFFILITIATVSTWHKKRM